MTAITPVSVPDSSRLHYRLMDERDADLLFDLDQDPEVMRFMSDGVPTPREEIDNFLVPFMLDLTQPASGYGLWAAESREKQEFLGWILVREYGYKTNYHNPLIVELGWRFKRHCWGWGIATEAAQAIMAAEKGVTAADRFCAIADEANLASTAVMKKLGMQFIDHRMHDTPKGRFPVVYYEMRVG